MDNTYAVSQLVGTSTEGIDTAIRNAVKSAGRTLRNLDWFEVTEIRGHIENGEVGHFQVALNIGFRVEE